MFGNKIKRFIVSYLIVVLFFLGLELTQRVRYSIRWKTPYWLGYGVTTKPINYNKLQENVIAGERKVKEDINIIKCPWVFYEGYRKNTPGDHDVEVGYQCHINSDGFRDGEISDKVDFRVVTLGGSTTFCVGVDDKDTFPSQLEIMTGYDVINAGVGAMRIDEINTLFKKEILRLDPDLIIINSMANNIYYHSVTYTNDSLIDKVNRWLLDYSLVYMTLKEKFARIRGKSCGDVWRISPNALPRKLMADSEFWKEQEGEYKTLVETARENGIKVLIIKQPILLGGDSKLYNKSMKPVWGRYYDMIDTFGVDVLNAKDKFMEEDLFCGDNLHLTIKGNKYLAKLISMSMGEFLD